MAKTTETFRFPTNFGCLEMFWLVVGITLSWQGPSWKGCLTMTACCRRWHYALCMIVLWMFGFNSTFKTLNHRDSFSLIVSSMLLCLCQACSHAASVLIFQPMYVHVFLAFWALAQHGVLALMRFCLTRILLTFQHPSTDHRGLPLCFRFYI